MGNVCGDTFVEGKVKPNYLVFFACYWCSLCCYFLYCYYRSLLLLLSLHKSLIFIAEFFECFLLFFFGVVKNLFTGRVFLAVNRLSNLANVWLYLVIGLKKHLCNWDDYFAFWKIEMSLWLSEKWHQKIQLQSNLFRLQFESQSSASFWYVMP